MLSNRNNTGNTSLTRRNNSELQSALSPLGSMPDIFDELYPVLATSPFRLMDRMQKDMDRLFSQFAGLPTQDSRRQGSTGQSFGSNLIAPNVDVSETPSEYRIDLELPGISQDAIDVRVVESTLTVSAEVQQQTGDADSGSSGQQQNPNQRKYLYRERSWGRFERMFHLPPDADENKIMADFTAGVLTLSIPKKQNQPEREHGRRISIGSTESSAEGNRTEVPSSATPTPAQVSWAVLS